MNDLNFFLTAEILIYFIFLILDMNKIQSGMSECLKYSGILLCFFYAVILAEKKKYRNVRNVNLSKTVALLFTLSADYFLLIRNEHYEIGVFFFCLVQSCYLTCTSKAWGKHLVVRIVFTAAVALCCYFGNILVFLLLFYGISSIGNLLLLFYRKTDFWLLSGLTLLFFCDLCVGVVNAGNYINLSISKVFFQIAAFLMWTFYLPSQVLIVISIKKSLENNGRI